MRDEVKRAGFYLFVLFVCILGVLFIRVKFFAVEASADIALPAEDYPDLGMVVNIIDDTPESLVVIQTRDGNQWVLRGAEDWWYGDFALLVFNDNGTRNNRTDDFIVNARYITLDDDYVPSYFKGLVAHL